MRKWIRWAAAACAALLAGCAAPSASVDATARIAVISAFEPELDLLLAKLEQPRRTRMNGVEFTTGVLQGKPVVMFLSGVSMTNAAMTTQLALDRFRISHLVFSGIAGGVNPRLNIGDVVVAGRWGQYLEVLMARESAPGRYDVPDRMKGYVLPNFGMMFPRPVEVRTAAHPQPAKQFWFDADPALMEVARRIGDVPLETCDAQRRCLGHKPQLVLGGNGVSGQAFVDNAAFRDYTYKTFEASVLDMETAAVAMVAHSNGVPFIAFRSLSDLAGGGQGENEIGTFFRLAADNSARVLLAFLAAWK